MLAGVFLYGCEEARSAPVDMEVDKDIGKVETPTMPYDAVVKFSDILAQYQALNTRLENVAARLQIANATLCPVTVRDAGFTAHTLTDYPERLQQVARGLLSVDESLSVRTVREGSTAARAGLRAGDKLIGVNGQRFVSGATQQKFYERAITSAFSNPSARLTVARSDADGEKNVMSFKLKPETICGYPAHVVFDEYVNGHTDGRAVWITSELMRTVDDDVNLALIVAHEMAHAMAGHLELNPSDEARKVLELQADSMALVMLSRAGFDVEHAIGYWSRADNPQRLSQSRSDTHPNITQRLNNFERAKAAIELAIRAGEPLNFQILPEPVL
jgi:hypothetical protein